MNNDDLIERLAQICTPQDIDKVRRYGQALVKLAESADMGILDAKRMVMAYQMNGTNPAKEAEEIEYLLLPPKTAAQVQAEWNLNHLAEQQRSAGDRRDGDEVDRLEAEMDKMRKIIESEKEKALEAMKQ